jgi:hypothetical protein
VDQTEIKPSERRNNELNLFPALCQFMQLTGQPSVINYITLGDHYAWKRKRLRLNDALLSLDCVSQLVIQLLRHGLSSASVGLSKCLKICASWGDYSGISG